MDKKNAILQDSGIERSVLAGIATHGADCFFVVEDILQITDFYWSHNQKLFKIFEYLVHEKDVKTFDSPSIQAIAKELGFNDFVGDGKLVEYLDAIVGETGPSFDNMQVLAIGIYKYSVARKGWVAAKKIHDKLATVTGAEGISDIIASIEEPIFDFTGKLMSHEAGVVNLGARYKKVMTKLAEDPKDIVGIPTGFPAYDRAIGGGLRPATVTVIGARPKIGKSFICLNMARNIAENGIPVLYLDTELTEEIQLHRLASLVSGIELNHIETGQFAGNKHETEAVWECQKHMENLPIDHCSIAGQPPQAIMSIARRWLSKSVGFMDSGAAKPCLIVYDYLKLMDAGDFKSKNLQEFQMLGFLVTALHNFAVKYRLPILATVQLNRDGIDKEGAEVASGSDRIVWLCSSFTILKKKSQKEFDEDPHVNGTKKLVVTDTRFGPGMELGDYINIKDKLEIGKLSEGQSYGNVVSATTLGNTA